MTQYKSHSLNLLYIIKFSHLCNASLSVNDNNGNRYQAIDNIAISVSVL